jgi:hypothetical protein
MEVGNEGIGCLALRCSRINLRHHVRDFLDTSGPASSERGRRLAAAGAATSHVESKTDLAGCYWTIRRRKRKSQLEGSGVVDRCCNFLIIIQPFRSRRFVNRRRDLRTCKSWCPLIPVSPVLRGGPHCKNRRDKHRCHAKAICDPLLANLLKNLFAGSPARGAKQIKRLGGFSALLDTLKNRQGNNTGNKILNAEGTDPVDPRRAEGSPIGGPSSAKRGAPARVPTPRMSPSGGLEITHHAPRGSGAPRNTDATRLIMICSQIAKIHPRRAGS